MDGQGLFLLLTDEGETETYRPLDTEGEYVNILRLTATYILTMTFVYERYPLAL